MIIILRPLTVFLCLLLWQPAWSAGPIDPTEAARVALQNLDHTKLDEDWYFTMELAKDGENLRIHSDPSREKYQRRRLLSVDGQTPDAKREKKFRDAEVKRIDERDVEKSRYAYLVNPDSLVLVEQGEDFARLSFEPRMDALNDSRGKMAGTVLLNTGTGQIDEIEIHNTDKLSPAFSVTLETYRLKLSFMLEQGEQMLQKMESHAIGKAGFVKSFDALVVIGFSEFKRADCCQTSRESHSASSSPALN